jgi:hypothetical protein
MVTIPEWNTVKPLKELLASKYAYVLDVGDELFVWNGKNATSQQKNLAMLIAYHLQQAKPIWTGITKVIEEGEHVLWKEKFIGYLGMLPIQTSAAPVTVKTSAPIQVEINLQDMLDGKYKIPKRVEKFDQVREHRMQIWRASETEKIPVQDPGHFYADEAYILQHTYKLKSENDLNAIMFWQGRDASKKIKGASALLSVGIDENGEAEQMRVEQNKEREWFLWSLKEVKLRAIVHLSRSINNHSRLYEIKGKDDIDTRAIELSNNVSFLYV